LSTTELGLLFGLQTITTLAIRPVIGFASDRAGRRWVIVAGLMVCGEPVLLISITAALTSTVIAILTYAAGVATTTAATSAYITDVTRRARYGAAHGVFGNDLRRRRRARSDCRRAARRSPRVFLHVSSHGRRRPRHGGRVRRRITALGCRARARGRVTPIVGVLDHAPGQLAV
jgi:hypothetical protein